MGTHVFLRWLPAVTLMFLLGPVVAGLLGTALPAFGYLPVLGGNTISLGPWRAFFAAPGVAESIRLSFVTGMLVTAFSFSVVILFVAGWHGTRSFGRVQKLLSPLLSIPHVTVACGLAFLMAPSGWIFRLTSPWLTGFERPPDLIIVQDPGGLALIAGLMIKEIPFLFLMTLAAIAQMDAVRLRTMARTLGYGTIAAWLKAVLPLVYRQIRLPVFAVIAFSTSVVDVSVVLGPTTPPPLAVQLVRWFNDPDLALRFMASAGALVQLGLVIAAFFVWWLGERLFAGLGRIWVRAGSRCRRDFPVRVVAATALVTSFLAAFLGLASMAVWSFAGRWRFPDTLPFRLSTDTWAANTDRLVNATFNTVTIGVTAALVGLLLTVGCLENESLFGRRRTNRSFFFLYLPLLVPQIAFLFGTQVLLIISNLDGTWIAVVWAHLVFVLPYVFLSLADPYRAWDVRYARAARCLGASRLRVFYRIKLPMLLRPVLVATAVGFTVSMGQYLPTLSAGAGRIDTLTTEAVSLASGADLRAIGAYSMLQMILPFIAFCLAAAAPAWLFRNRLELRVTA